MAFLPVEQQLKIIRRGTTEIVPEAELVEKLVKSNQNNRPLTVKLGCDPTRPDLHLGHTVILRKLRQFQELGHRAVLIIGDFTASIGDPSGQNKTRPPLSEAEISQNAETYLQQVSVILDIDQTTVVYNSEWLGRMDFSDVIRLASKVTVARMIERDDFSKRFENREPISLHEFLYPVAQGQDSVHLHADIELGGTDQKFNLLVGRDLQKAGGQSPQIALMMPLLVGTDGVKKMSKSYDNYIGITESANDMYGKVLSIPDELIYPWFELLSDVPVSKLPEYKKLAQSNPRDAKHELAKRITSIYHSEQAANSARKYFEKTVIGNEVPNDAPVFEYETGREVRLLDIIADTGFTQSNGQTKRLIKQGGVSIDDEKITDKGYSILFDNETEFTLKVGKRNFAVIKSEDES
jgi:tyrosyl-tRNA synthetase